MAKRLNKKLIAGLTIAGMAITTAACIVMVMSLPKRDPKPAAAKAASYAAQGEYAAAVQWYQKAYQRSRSGGSNTAESNKYLVYLGDVYLAQGDARQALAAWGQALLNDPNYEEAQQKILEFRLELARIRRDSWVNVQSAAETLLRINPQNYTGLHAMGLALIQQRNIKEENLSKGEEMLRKAFEGDKSNSVFVNDLASYYFQEGQPDKATEVYDELIAHLPEDPKSQATAWCYRGQFYVLKMAREQGELQRKREGGAIAAELTPLEKHLHESDVEALRCLKKALELAPDREENLIAMGEYWTVKQPMADQEEEQATERKYAQAKAEDYYKQAIQANPDGYEAYLRLAQLHLVRKHDVDGAAQVLMERHKRGIQREGYLGSHNKWYMSSLRDELFVIGMMQCDRYRQQKTSQADEKLQDAIKQLEGLYQEQRAEVGEESPGVLFMKGRLLWLQRDLTGAIKALEKADKLLPRTEPKLKSYLAQLYLESGEYGPAREALNMVLQAYPNNPNTWAMMARLQVQLGDLGKAAQAAQRALAIDPEQRSALLALMRVAEKQENWDKVRELQQALVKQNKSQDKLQRAVIDRAQALSGDEPDQALLEESERLLREVLDEDPLNPLALRQLVTLLARDPDRADELQKLVQEQKAIAQSKLEAVRAATQPSEEDQTYYQQLLAGIERLGVLADKDASKEDKQQRLEELIKHGKDPFVVAIELYQLYSQDEKHADEALAQLKKAHELRPDEKSVVDSLFRVALQRKDWAMAEEFVEKAIALGLDRSGGHFYRGRLLLARTDQEGNIKAAADHFRAGLVEFPTYSQGHLLLGRALVLLKQYDEAKQSFQEALRMNPRNGQAALGLASLAALRGQEAEKAKWLDLCEKLIPDHPWVKAELQAEEDTRDPKQGIARREEIRKSDPKDGNNLYRLARLYEQEKEYTKAQAAFEECCQLDPKNFQLINDYTRFLRSKTPPDYEAATQMLQKLVEKASPDNGDEKGTAQLLLATHLEELFKRGAKEGLDQKACDEAYEAAAGMSDSPTVRMDIGLYYLGNARLEKAEGWFRKAIASAEAKQQEANEQMARERLIDTLIQINDPNREEDLKKEIDNYDKKYDSVFALMAKAEYHAQAGRLEQALEFVEQYIDKRPEDPVGYLRRGDINFHRSLWQEALEDYRKTKSLNPKGYHYEPRLRLALCLENRGENDLAITELSSILAEDENQMSVFANLLRLLKKLKRWEAAEELIRARRDREPASPQWPLLLLNLYRASGDAEQAIKYGTEAVEKAQFDDSAVGLLLNAYLEFKRYDDLIRFVNKTLPADRRKAPPVILMTAVAYASQGDRFKALEQYNQALDLLSGRIQVFTGVATSLIEHLGADEARKVIEARLNQHPEERPSRFVLGMLQRDAGNLDQFVATVNDLLKTLPEDGDAQAVHERLFLLHSLATSYSQSVTYAEAQRKIYEDILKINPSDVMALNNLAYLLMDHFKDAQSALPYAKQAVQLVSSEPNVLDTLGWNFVLLGKYDEALAMLRRSIGINDGLAAVHYHVAEVFRRRAEKDASRRDADLKEAKTECSRAYDLLLSGNQDTGGLMDQVVALGDKLGLTLDKKRPGR